MHGIVKDVTDKKKNHQPKKLNIMRSQIKMTRSLNSVIDNNEFVNRDNINNSNEALWVGIKRYLH